MNSINLRVTLRIPAGLLKIVQILSKNLRAERLGHSYHEGASGVVLVSRPGSGHQYHARGTLVVAVSKPFSSEIF